MPPHAGAEPGGDRKLTRLASGRQDSAFGSARDRGFARPASNLGLLQRDRFHLVVPDRVSRVGVQFRELPWEVFVRRRRKPVLSYEHIVFDDSKACDVDATLNADEHA